LAKKRRQKVEKKEDYVFTPPEVDKNQFIRDEIRNAKATFISFGFAVLMAFVSFGFLLALDDFRVGGVIGLFAVAGLPFIYNFFKLDISGFEWKNWAGVLAVYIFSWLMISIILSNPPITDIASPEIRDISVQLYEEKIENNQTVSLWVPIERNTDGDIVVPYNKTFRIVATVIDNGNLDENSIQISFQSISSFTGNVQVIKLGDNEYGFESKFSPTNSQQGDYSFKISARDTKGNEAVKSGTFIVI